MSAVRKCAIVTGIARASGIGRAIATAFLKDGFRVTGVDIEELEEDTYLRNHTSFLFLRKDITASNAPNEIVASTLEHFQTKVIHILVNNAGIANPYLTEADAATQWHNVLATNLTSAFLLSRAVLPYMPTASSSIIHIASTRARQSEPNSEAYAASKAGLLGLTHSQAASLSGKVRVNVILPGWIDVSGGKESVAPGDHAWHWAGRVGQPSDVSQMCVFLADEEKAGFITGQEFVVDGGVSRKMVYPE